MLELVGTANDAAVYTVADYSAANSDELSFKAGDQLTILRQGDEDEPLWWWARNQDGVEGFVPPNLVAVSRTFFTLQLNDHNHSKHCMIDMSCLLGDKSL